MKKNEKEKKKSYCLKDQGGRMGGKRTKERSARGKKTKTGSARGRKTKGGNVGDKKTKEENVGGRMTGILVVVSIFIVVGILVCLLVSFYFGYKVFALAAHI